MVHLQANDRLANMIYGFAAQTLVEGTQEMQQTEF